MEQAAIGLEEQNAVSLDDAIKLDFPKDTLFKAYDCTVRLGSDLMHTVQKVNVTARTIQLLRAIHGDGGVVDIKETGTIKMNSMVHYFELALEYSKTMDPSHGVSLVEKTFGTRLLAFEPWYNDRMEKKDARREIDFQKKNVEASLYQINRDASDAKTKAHIAESAATKSLDRLSQPEAGLVDEIESVETDIGEVKI